MEKWDIYLAFLNNGKGNVLFRTLFGLVLLPWFMFCAVIKVVLFLFALLSGLIAACASIWKKLMVIIVLVVTVMQMTGNTIGDVPFWRIDTLWLFALQILATCFIVFAPEFLATFASASGIVVAGIVEEFNVWLLNKLS